jgi:hypothetical protein
VTWLTAALAKYLIIAGILAAVAGGIWKSGANYERRKCDAAALRSELAAARKDLAAEKRARAEDQKAIGEIAAEKQKAESDNDKLRNEIKSLPVADQCIIPPDRARRMQ